jgi:hypothetical protein
LAVSLDRSCGRLLGRLDRLVPLLISLLKERVRPNEELWERIDAGVLNVARRSVRIELLLGRDSPGEAHARVTARMMRSVRRTRHPRRRAEGLSGWHGSDSTPAGRPQPVARTWP